MSASKTTKSPKLSKITGLPIDPKRSRAAKKAAATRKANALKVNESRSLRLHHKILAGSAIVVVLAFTFLGIRGQLEAFAASSATGSFVGLGGKCLDNSGARLQANNRIQLYKCNGSLAQKWVLTSSGSLKANAGSNYCLDVPGNSKAEYTYLRLWKCNNSAAQHFYVRNNALIGMTTKFCATVHYAETSNGTKIWMKSCHGSAAQKWTYSGASSTPVTTNPGGTTPDNGGGSGSTGGGSTTPTPAPKPTPSPTPSANVTARFDPNSITSNFTDIGGNRLWKDAQRPSNPGANGPEQKDRIRVVVASDVPGRSQQYAPQGNALRFEIRPFNGGSGDVTTTGSDQRSRSEVLSSTSLIPYGQMRWYGWAQYLDSGWPLSSSNWLELTQFKNSGTGSPPASFGIDGSDYVIEGHGAGESQLKIGKVATGQWDYWQIGYLPSVDRSKGTVEVWRNGVQVLAPTHRVTALGSSSSPLDNYLKQGIYETTSWTSTHIKYQGATTVGTTRDSVAFQGI